MSILGELKEKVKLGLELALIGAASIGWMAATKAYPAYQQPPVIVQQASQEKQAPSASYIQQSEVQAEDDDNVDVLIPLYYDQLTGDQKMYLLNAKRIYKVKIMEGDTITKYVKGEDWPDHIPLSDSLIGVIFTALNGKNANINMLIAGQHILLEDMAGDGVGDGLILGREGERVPATEVEKIIAKNVYNGRKK